MSFDFTGFNGRNYSYKDLPTSISQYDYYLFLGSSPGSGLTLICFNSDISVNRAGYKCSVSCSDENSFMVFSYNVNSLDWRKRGEFHNFEIGDYNYSYSPVYCSDNLLDYRDLITSSSFVLPPPPTYTLLPIIEEQNISSSDVFGEIFGVLPVLLVVLASFIGIRKGIQYLFRLLRSS